MSENDISVAAGIAAKGFDIASSGKKRKLIA